MLDVLRLPSSDKAVTRAAAYHTVIIDRSGSMSGVIGRVVKDAASRIQYVATGDRFRVMWYSTEGGQWGVGYDGVILSEADRQLATDKTLQLGNTIGLTCFSEVLTDWANSLQGWSGPATLVLLTDGYPVVSNLRKEHTAIAAALQVARRYNVAAAAFVGYGYYDRNTLSDMQSVIGGTIVHADNLMLFGEAMGSMIGGTSNMYDLDVSEIVAGLDDPLVFTFRDGLPVSLPVTDGIVKTTGDVYVSHPKMKRSGIKDDAPFYGAAVLWNQRGRGDIASDLIALIGDKALFDRLSNALSPHDHSNAEAAILDAIKTPSNRYVHGKHGNLQVDPNAFSFFGLLDILQGNQGVTFVPKMEGWTYNRIGAASVKKDGVITRFEAEDTEVDFSDLVFDSERLNLSIRVQYDGSVVVPENNAKEYGIPTRIKSRQYRNYTLMRDGKLNVTHLPLRLPVDVAKLLLSKGLQFTASQWDHGTVKALVDISELPVMNRNEAAAGGKFADVAMLLAREAGLQAYQNLLNGLTKMEREASKAAAYVDVFGQAAADWLKEQGVTSGGYNPPSVTVKSGDTYPVTVVRFGLKGLSSLDTSYGKMLIKAAEANFNDRTASLPDKVKLMLAHEQLRSVRRDLLEVRRKLTAAKFGIVFTGRWFSDLPSRDVDSLPIDIIDNGKVILTTDATIKVTEKQIPI